MKTKKLGVFLLMALAGCGPALTLPSLDGGSEVGAVTPRCVGGTTLSCGCVGVGMVGVQRCDPATGSYGACECPLPTPADSGSEVGSGADAASAVDAPPPQDSPDVTAAVEVGVDAPAPADSPITAPDAGTLDVSDSGPCRPGLAWCGEAGCRSLLTDPNHCGWCGNRIGSPLPDPLHRVLMCREGRPVRVCENGWCAAGWTTAEPPDGGVELGCSVSVVDGLPGSTPGVNRFVHHCGACGRTCTAPLGAYSTCTASQCGWACLVGRGDCNRDPADGCEISIEQNPFHCGACGRQCATGERCAAGRCVAV